MTIEQKAKAYDEALWKAGELYQPSDSALLEEIFPELIKYNDEKVRGAIIHFISHTPTVPIGRINKETMLTWLEKQGEQNPIMAKSPQLGEQKPVDIAPKFHEGEWVVSPNGVYWHIDKISNNRYEVTSNTGESSNWPLDTNIYHKFTIQDAKKGDILACGKCILIFDQLSEFNNEQVLMDICHCTSKGFYWQDTKDRDLWALDGFKPATKEQRDALFAKMHEAGYKWDAEKKELKKISQRMISAKVKEAMYGNPAWSEEDENILEAITYTVKNSGYSHCIGVSIKVMIDWLKSLEQRIGG